MEFLVDSGAERSTVQTLPEGCKKSPEKLQVIGAKGEPFEVPVIKDVMIETGNKYGMGSFLLVPEAEYNLLGRDLMIELGIGIIIDHNELRINLCPLTIQDKEQINPEVWYNPETVGKLDIEPFSVTIRNPENPVTIKQYPISEEGRWGLKPEIDRL